MAEFNTLPSAHKVALVTGGNRGIGRETVWQLARLGVHVIIGARDLAKANSVAADVQSQGYSAEGVALDVSAGDSRHTAASMIEARHGKLDILINNAGTWLESEDASHPVANNTSTLAEDVLRSIFDVNFFGTVALTQTLLPLIRKSAAGRIVNVSSVLGSLTLHSDYGSVVGGSKAFGYDASKTALNAFTVHLAHELRDTPIKVNSIHPGWVRSEMGGTAADMSLEEGARLSVRFATLADDGPSGQYHFDSVLPW
ncbi:short-chain dehydrogenase [Burkholderia sp. WAC0059]|uniref:SDR family oxidoreductase n=1 Tax=Burkholderia sp. WAC0059 TaxID=2066022 RepID=UPI000C7E95B8|nr:SDR family oxidoreductase [Burkholderia sp. WAC0059]PLZ00722.1 short-chain dehydrogenase [Burkholderia sp. WAC0059]